MHKGKRIAAVIPAYDEEAVVGDVVSTFKGLRGDGGAAFLDRIVVVDNGSTDATARIAAEAGAMVVREPRRGYGAACLAGIAVLDPDTDVILFADADRSDLPVEAFLLLDAIAAGADLAVGSRALGKAEPGSLTPQQRFGNRLAALLIRLLFGARVTDLGPFRAIRKDALARLGMKDRTWGWTVEMQVKAALEGLDTREIPVTYRKRVGKSKISGTLRGSAAAGWKILSTILLLRASSFPVRRGSGRRDRSQSPQRGG